MSNKKMVILLFSLFYLPLANAQWHCIANDAANRQWLAISNYQRNATNKALEVCKRESQLPASCKTSKEDCDLFVNGVSTRPMWQCTAFDQMAKAWLSNPYTKRDDAALAAKAYCQEHSGFPDTCYVHLFTCKNLNTAN